MWWLALLEGPKICWKRVTLSNNTSKTSGIQLGKRYLILDEADRLLEPSLQTQVFEINAYLPKTKQVVLTSATIQQQKIKQELLSQLSPNPFQFYSLNDQIKTVETLDQKYLLVPKAVKDFYLIHLVQQYQQSQIIVFVNTCKYYFIITYNFNRKANMLYQIFQELGLETTCLHSKLLQLQRSSNLKKFKNSRKNILVCTDVASRGLDIPTVVINLIYFST